MKIKIIRKEESEVEGKELIATLHSLGKACQTLIESYPVVFGMLQKRYFERWKDDRENIPLPLFDKKLDLEIQIQNTRK